MFHRKNYFYPGQPKAYQISQYDQPICARWPSGRGRRTASASPARTSRRTPPSWCTRRRGGRIGGAEYSLVDFNRCGTPLVEIVTEPDLRSPEQAVPSWRS